MSIGYRGDDTWHGNEPSHHIAFLYSYAGEPWKTQQRVHQIMTTQYGNQPNSLCGNDDCRQMSAWYIFNALGFYLVCPGSCSYVLGTPVVERVESNWPTERLHGDRNEPLRRQHVCAVRQGEREAVEICVSPFRPGEERRFAGICDGIPTE